MSQIKYIKEQNPWFSFKPYQESDACSFKGRGIDIAKMMKYVIDNDIIVCYAKSGIGKSSLINAGLMPRMRRKQLLPIPIKFTEDFFSKEPFERAIRKQIEAEIVKLNNSVKDNKKDEEYIIVQHSSIDSNPLMKLADDILSNSSIWWWLNTYNIICKRGEFEIIYQPILIFDQFEELFQKTQTEEQRMAFFGWLKDMSLKRPSDETQKRLEELQNNHPDSRIAIPDECGWKILIALREDFVGLMDYWCTQKIRIPEIQDNRYCLMPLTTEQAHEVISEQTIDEERVSILDEYEQAIIDSLQDSDGIPAMLLSVLCNKIFEELVGGKSETARELHNLANEKDQEFIKRLLLQVYEDRLSASGVGKRMARVIEHLLVRDNGYRKRLDMSDMTTKQQKACRKLADVYLVRIEEYGKRRLKNRTTSIEWIEIIHDRVAEVIAEKRKTVSTRKKRLWLLLTSFFVIAFLLFGTFLYINREKEAIILLIEDESISLTDYWKANFTIVSDKDTVVYNETVDKVSPRLIFRYRKQEKLYCYINFLVGDLTSVKKQINLNDSSAFNIEISKIGNHKRYEGKVIASSGSGAPIFDAIVIIGEQVTKTNIFGKFVLYSDSNAIGNDGKIRIVKNEYNYYEGKILPNGSIYKIGLRNSAHFRQELTKIQEKLDTFGITNLEGKVNGKFSVKMKVTFKKDSIYGLFYYNNTYSKEPKKRKYLSYFLLNGTLDRSNNIFHMSSIDAVQNKCVYEGYIKDGQWSGTCVSYGNTKWEFIFKELNQESSLPQISSTK